MSNNKFTKTILVSGASGLLGSELIVQILNKTAYKVIALTSKKNKVQLLSCSERLIVFSNDEWDQKINQKVDVFINCAFPRSSDPEKLAIGADYTEYIVQDAISRNISNIINISSQSVYSQKSIKDIDESDSPSPESLYGMAKYASEKIVSSICENYNQKINFSNIRLASLTSLDFDIRMINRFVKKVINNEIIEIYGGDQTISYLDVRDAADALVQMLNTTDIDWNVVYNLGSNEKYTLNNLVKEIERVAKDYNFQKVKVNKHTKDEAFSNSINSTLFYDTFNWKPRHQMLNMIEELFVYYVR